MRFQGFSGDKVNGGGVREKIEIWGVSVGLKTRDILIRISIICVMLKLFNI